MNESHNTLHLLAARQPTKFTQMVYIPYDSPEGRKLIECTAPEKEGAEALARTALALLNEKGYVVQGEARFDIFQSTETRQCFFGVARNLHRQWGRESWLNEVSLFSALEPLICMEASALPMEFNLAIGRAMALAKTTVGTSRAGMGARRFYEWVCTGDEALLPEVEARFQPWLELAHSAIYNSTTIIGSGGETSQ